MKITKIESEKDSYGIYLVTFTPNFIEKIFGIKEKVEKFKDNGSTYTFGGGTAYICQDGGKTGNGNEIGVAIDKWRKKF